MWRLTALNAAENLKLKLKFKDETEKSFKHC
jgi:hypothetical protein